MKKLLEEVLKEATPGPLRTFRLSEYIVIGEAPPAHAWPVARVVGLPNAAENAALLAHFRNVGPELVEALDALTLVVGLTPIAGNKEALQEAMDQARDLLSRAKEVEVP